MFIISRVKLGLGAGLVLATVWLCGAVWAQDDALRFRVEGSVAYGNGTIYPGSARYFERFMEDHPEVRTLVLQDMPGSQSERATLALARHIRRLGLNTHLTAQSDIASGATDVFVGGVKRTIACGAGFGVHSWQATEVGPDGSMSVYTARDIARDPNHVDHKATIRYFEDMGLTAKFYWFTVDAAPFQGMYYMTPTQLEQFGIVTEPMGCDRR